MSQVLDFSDPSRLYAGEIEVWKLELSRQDAATAIRHDVAKRNYYNPSV